MRFWSLRAVASIDIMARMGRIVLSTKSERSRAPWGTHGGVSLRDRVCAVLCSLHTRVALIVGFLLHGRRSRGTLSFVTISCAWPWLNAAKSTPAGTSRLLLFRDSKKRYHASSRVTSRVDSSQAGGKSGTVARTLKGLHQGTHRV